MASSNDINYREHYRFNGDSGAKLTMSKFGTNDVDQASDTLTYVGQEDPEGIWAIKKIDTTSGTEIRYATNINNDSYTSYTSAWTDHTSLVYGTFSQAF